MFIGISGGSTHFSGLIDKVRFWNRELSAEEVMENMRTSLGTSCGIYEGLVLSMTFQKESSDGTRLLECWVYPLTANQTCNLITKGNQYAHTLENGIFKTKINGSTASSNTTIQANKWAKLTMQYQGSPDFHINGEYINTTHPAMGNLVSGTDSLYIGSVLGEGGDFYGWGKDLQSLFH